MSNGKRESGAVALPVLTRLKLFVSELITYLTTRSDGSLNRRLFNLLDLKASAPSTKLINAIHVTTSDITVDPSRNLWFRLFTPATSTSAPVPLIVYFHGGGFTKYAPDSKVFDHLCSHLAAHVPAVVASVNYRLAPDHKHPSQYEDGFDVLRFIDARPHLVNADIGRCFVGGDSAGGNIAHHVTVRAVEEVEQFGMLRIVGLLGLQPFFGGEERTDSEVRLTKVPGRMDRYWRDFLPEGADRDHPAANVCGTGRDVTHLRFPPCLVVVGGRDPLQDWQRRYVEWLRTCGKPVFVVHYPNAFHAFYAFPELPDFHLLLQDVASFVREQLNSY
ncbi:probable carboxylesterase 18 [Salvia hispanica]|uniref:probable carboxylesterase 18 n=1 Tax=Salvia hispanica TaxID=49212 RepID=UPI002009BE64|nr:probable carboxylesterase 18 [Salvia hispanica]